MKVKIFSTIISLLMILSLTFIACTPDTPETTATPSPTPAVTAPPTGETNWWDKFGEPQYGGTINFCTFSVDNLAWDPVDMTGGSWKEMWLEPLFYFDWTTDRDTWAFVTDYTPLEYYGGIIAESWEWPDNQTCIIHIREGVYWQDRPPVNGRELTAEDVKYSIDRLIATGSGFTERAPFYANTLAEATSTEVIDKYTLSINFTNLKATTANNLISRIATQIIAPEWAEQGDTRNWENAVGSGPWLMEDFTAGTSLTLARNPDYWGYDERYPENQLPYADEVKVIAISDRATMIAGLRSGRLDMVTIPRGEGITWHQAQSLNETNPELEQAWWPMGGPCLDFRCDTEPFTDIRVRRAMEMSVDRETIARTHYGGTIDGTPCSITTNVYEDFTTPYDEWPAEIQEAYSYNTERARELLADAGYPDGFDTNIVCSSADDLESVEIVKSYFQDIGVEMEIKVVDSASVMSYLWAGKHDQMSFSTRTGMTFSPYDCFDLRMSNNLFNQTFNNDPVYEAMVTELVNNPNPSNEAIREIDMYMLEQCWSVHLFGTRSPVFWQPYIKGYSGEIVQNAPGSYFARWWVDESLK